MNLSALERMARDGDMSADALRYLLSCRGECEWLDFKEDLHIDDDKELCNFARDILAIKNVGGGYIVVGVQDKTWRPVGLKAPLPYDSKLLRDKIRKASNIDLDIDIVHHEIYQPSSSGQFAIIFVRASRKRKKRRTPVLVAKDFCTGKLYGLRRGDIFVRRGDSTIKIQSQSDLEELLDNLEAQADHDALMTIGETSPFAVEEGLYRLLEKGFEHFIGRTHLRDDLLAAVTKDPRIWIINVHGPGGVGKSALVNWVVYQFYQERAFESIIHLTAKETILAPTGIERFGRSLYSLENLLDHILLTFQEPPPADLENKKQLAIEILSAWNALLVLDNMETVQDGRILSFIQGLPTGVRVKVLLTSRQKTGGWELPFPLIELTVDEVQEFLQIRSKEMDIAFPCDQGSAERVWQVTGGLPLAIQWLLGRYRSTGSVKQVLSEVIDRNSPVLEFSFRNIWQILSTDARTVLAVITIFEEPPTSQQISIAIEHPIERVERALVELADVTLVNRSMQASDGRITYIALPITLSFARHQLGTMGDLEAKCRQRYQRFSDQMALHEAEIAKFRSRFDKYGLGTDNEKRAAILCQKGESEMFFGNVDNADLLFKQARELAPRCAYVYAMSASYELARNRIGNALNMAEQACTRANKKNGALCYTIKARILDVQRDRRGRAKALAKAVEYDPDDHVVRHQYGVALSRDQQTEEAIQQFTIIIDRERDRTPPPLQVLMALKTRMINLKRLGAHGRASTGS
jgi:tetratricopeptide (TPR) repeat protein